MGKLHTCMNCTTDVTRQENEFKKLTVFENHRKSRIQHCERSELHLHFESDSVTR